MDAITILKDAGEQIFDNAHIIHMEVNVTDVSWAEVRNGREVIPLYRVRTGNWTVDEEYQMDREEHARDRAEWEALQDYRD